jgi:hypothetical protein
MFPCYITGVELENSTRKTAVGPRTMVIVDEPSISEGLTKEARRYERLSFCAFVCGWTGENETGQGNELLKLHHCICICQYEIWLHVKCCYQLQPAEARISKLASCKSVSVGYQGSLLSISFDAQSEARPRLESTKKEKQRRAMRATRPSWQVRLLSQ